VCQQQAAAAALKAALPAGSSALAALGGGDLASSCRDFLQQLGYREYGRYLAFHFPFIHERR
jgi:hypothetical protein